MTKWIILFLLLPSLAFSGQGMGPGPGGKTYSAGGGATWFWAGGLSDTDYPTAFDNGYQTSAYLYGNDITPTISGTITSIAVKAQVSVGTEDIKLGIYNTSNALLASCLIANVSSAEGVTWKFCNVSVAASSGTTYRVLASGESNTVWWYFKDGGSDVYGTCAYAEAMCNPPTAVGSDPITVGVKILVTP